MSVTKILLVGKSGRLDCLAEALAKSRRPKQIFVLSEVSNPGLRDKADNVRIGKTDDPLFVTAQAREIGPDFAIIGPEEPLAAGVVDALSQLGVPSVGPTRKLAKLETSKSFTRELIRKNKIPGNPRYSVFRTLDGIQACLQKLGTYVVKPDGLTGGKGVKVFGEHLASHEEAFQYCSEVLAAGAEAVVVEERLEGEEFSLQSFYDGKNIVHMAPVQDHKRAWEGDQGPNTGGMGSYSCADNSLPFLSHADVAAAGDINRRVGEALFKETGERYKGILYGGFMVTPHGLRVIEYNARFGDPEVMNVLPLIQTDFIEVCEAIIEGTLDQLQISFRREATVCKYLVPDGYPGALTADGEINVDGVTSMEGYGDNLRMYYAAVRDEGGALRLTGSRAMALLGIGENLAEAEQIVERAASAVLGPVYHRRDIGKAALIAQRVHHVQSMLDRHTQRKIAV